MNDFEYNTSDYVKIPSIEEVKMGYMCDTSWEFELGEARGGTKVYASKKECQEAHPGCLVVAVYLRKK